MNKEIQPDYHKVTVTCACGNTFETRSTKPGDTIKCDVCNKCHPFYTGQKKLVDTAGRVDKFKKKFDLQHIIFWDAFCIKYFTLAKCVFVYIGCKDAVI